MTNTDYGLRATEERVGISFDIWHSGGGYLIAEARLEGGLWLWVTDRDAGLYPLAERQGIESQGIAIGYQIAIHPDDSGEPDSNITLASVCDDTATNDRLPELVALAIESIATNAHHEFNRIDFVRTCGCGPVSCSHSEWKTVRNDGAHTVRNGIEEC